MSEVAVTNAVVAQGVPKRSLAAKLGVGTVAKILRTAVHMHTRYDWYRLTGMMGNAAGYIVGWVKHRYLDL